MRVLFLLLLSQCVFATSSPVEIKNIVFGGSGCSKDTAIELSTGDGAVRFILGSFRLEAGGEALTFNRLNCDVILPIVVKPGYQVALPSVEVKGKNDLAVNARLFLRMESFFAGQTGWTAKETYKTSGAFTQQSPERPKEDIWSPCGKAVNLRVKISASLQNIDKTVLSSALLERGTILPLQTRKCE